MKEKIYVIFTMDCERIKKFSPPGGPETWKLSERAIEGFAEVISAKNLLATFFIVPETAHRHRDLFLALKRKGFELGMHLHPQSLGDLRYKDYLGGYSLEKQIEILKEATNIWAEALGETPKSFRPGNFSANDSTFKALYTVGFRQGSVSAPEREMPEFKAVWRGTYPYAHHVHPDFRLIPGELDFYEVPITVDWDRRTWQGKSAMELRVEMGGSKDHFSTIKKRILDMKGKKIPVKTLVAITHNYFDYKSKRERQRKTLEKITNYLWRCADELNFQLCPITLSHLHQIVDEEERGE